ncbi:hypothetical protein AB3I13_04025 [Enterococcus sp. C62]|uniref:hypothetical protein n=1 Tax=Enterococcus sp. C62 TaxID=3231323 RepID=UPI0034A05DF5
MGTTFKRSSNRPLHRASKRFRKKEIKTSLKVEELEGFIIKVKFHDSDTFNSIWGDAKFHVDNDRRIIKLQKIKEQLDEIAPANLLQPVVVKILTNNKCDYQDLKLREAIVSYDKTAIEINRQLKSEFRAMGVTFKEVSRDQILRRIFKNLDKGLNSEKEQIAEVLSDSNLNYNNKLNTLLVQFEKKVHEYIPYLDTLIQKEYEDKGDVSLTNKRILELVENEPGLKDLLVCCQNMLPSYPLKNYAQTIPMVSTYFANLAHQIEETYQSPGKKLAKQIFMLGKLDPLYCAKMIQYLSAQYTNKQPNPLPIHPNILIQNKMEKIVERYHDLYPLPSFRSELTGKKVVNKVANEVVGNVERPISTPIIEQSSQPFDWSPSVILNQEVRPTETAKAIVAFHNKNRNLEMTKQLVDYAGIPKILPKELQELQKNIPTQTKSTMSSFDFITQNDQSVKGNQRTQVSMQQIMEKAGNHPINSPMVSERTHGTSINRGESTNERSMPNDRQLSEKLSYNR